MGLTGGMTPDAPPLQQHPGHACALAAMGLRADRVEREGVAMVRLRRGPLSATFRGPVWPPGMTPDRRADWLRRHGPRLVEGEAGDGPALHAAGYRQLMTGGWVAALDLTGGAAAIRARAHGKWRNRATRAAREGLRLRNEVFAGEEDHWLLSAEAEQRAARAYRALPLALTRAWAQTSPGAARLFALEQGTTAVAGMLFLRHGEAVTYITGWTGEEGRRLSAHHLILLRAAGWFAGRGARRMDLGALDTVNAPGLARFKLGSGATASQLAGSWLKLRPRSFF